MIYCQIKVKEQYMILVDIVILTKIFKNNNNNRKVKNLRIDNNFTKKLFKILMLFLSVKARLEQGLLKKEKIYKFNCM